MNEKVKVIGWLHILLLICSLLGMCSKFAARYDFFSIKFLCLYGIVVLNLGIYAICWQQIIKKLSLTTAFANKAITVVWGIVWGFIFWGETITIQKVLGVIVIVIGIVLVVSEKEEEDA